VDLYLN